MKPKDKSREEILEEKLDAKNRHIKIVTDVAIVAIVLLSVAVGIILFPE